MSPALSLCTNRSAGDSSHTVLRKEAGTRAFHPLYFQAQDSLSVFIGPEMVWNKSIAQGSLSLPRPRLMSRSQ